jgi:hypothetical protein
VALEANVGHWTGDTDTRLLRIGTGQSYWLRCCVDHGGRFHWICQWPRTAKHQGLSTPTTIPLRRSSGRSAMREQKRETMIVLYSSIWFYGNSRFVLFLKDDRAFCPIIYKSQPSKQANE